MTRSPASQAQHDHAIAALAAFYTRKQDDVWANPGDQHNKAFSGLHPDLIVHDRKGYYLFEVETAESISEEEAINEWSEFDHAWKVWFLAVPADQKMAAIRVLNDLGIHHCKVVTWQSREDGIPTFAGLP